jgi:hypothetical protein
MMSYCFEFNQDSQYSPGIRAKDFQFPKHQYPTKYSITTFKPYV